MSEGHVFSVKLSLMHFKEATGVHFTGMSINVAESGFNCVIRGTNKAGSPVYAMMNDDDPEAVINALFSALCSEYAGMLWRKDTWAAERGK